LPRRKPSFRPPGVGNARRPRGGREGRDKFFCGACKGQEKPLGAWDLSPVRPPKQTTISPGPPPFPGIDFRARPGLSGGPFKPNGNGPQGPGGLPTQPKIPGCRLASWVFEPGTAQGGRALTVLKWAARYGRWPHIRARTGPPGSFQKPWDEVPDVRCHCRDPRQGLFVPHPKGPFQRGRGGKMAFRGVPAGAGPASGFGANPTFAAFSAVLRQKTAGAGIGRRREGTVG